jgi:hypothetical protein
MAWPGDALCSPEDRESTCRLTQAFDRCHVRVSWP